MVYLDARNGEPGRRMERLSAVNLQAILRYALRAGMVLFIDTDGELKGYPKNNPAFQKVRRMLDGIHPEMKMHIIRNIQGEENVCQFN